MIWFTADTHFGHANIITYCRRPFADVEEMNESLIARWNAVVGRRDEVWHLGDVAFRGDPAQYLRRLHGRIAIILGNHDRAKLLGKILDGRVHDVHYLRHEGKRFFLSHYAHRVWPEAQHGSYHLYGHSHGHLLPYLRSMDVGVDVPGLDYSPTPLPTVVERLEQATANFHHPEFVA